MTAWFVWLGKECTEISEKSGEIGRLMGYRFCGVENGTGGNGIVKVMRVDEPRNSVDNSLNNLKVKGCLTY